MLASGNRTILIAWNFEVVNKLVYLGAPVTPKKDVGLEIQQKFKLQIGAFVDHDPLYNAVRQ
jgi:hypothetical protein